MSGAEAVAKLQQVGYTDTAHARSAAAVRLVDRAANLIVMMTFYLTVLSLLQYVRNLRQGHATVLLCFGGQFVYVRHLHRRR